MSLVEVSSIQTNTKEGVGISMKITPIMPVTNEEPESVNNALVVYKNNGPLVVHEPIMKSVLIQDLCPISETNKNIPPPKLKDTMQVKNADINMQNMLNINNVSSLAPNEGMTIVDIVVKPNEEIMKRIKKALVELFIETTNNNAIFEPCSVKKLAFKTFMNLYGNELEIQEKKYQHLIDELTIKLAEKQQEVVDLVGTLKDVKNSSEKDTANQQLEIKVEELKRLVREKEAVAESIRVDLQYIKNESEFSNAKMKRLEEDLGKAQETLSSLQEQNTSITNELTRSRDLEENVKKLSEELKLTESIKKDLKTTLDEIEAERDEEMKIVQDALDEAAQEREDLLKSFEVELKNLNKTNSAREQQMLDDFEWKLREMEKGHKIKVDEKEKQAVERVDAVRSAVESELSESLSKVAEDRRIADEQIAMVGHLKSYEPEVIQLRGVVHEFQLALNCSAREVENFRVKDKLLEEEIRTLKKNALTRQNLLQRTKRQEEEDAQQNLNKMKSKLHAEWENKLIFECSRLRSELDELHVEEKRLAVNSWKIQKEQEFQTMKKSCEIRQNETNDEISKLKSKLMESETNYSTEIVNQRTSTDRIIWDLRMKLQKITISSFDLKQQLDEKHKEEMERFRFDQLERYKELELRLEKYDNQSGVDVVGQLEKKHKIQMDHVGEQHQISMERFREELESDKFQAVEEARVIITRHHEFLETSLKDKIGELQQGCSQSSEELDRTQQNLSRKEETIRSLEDELERLRDCFSNTNCSQGSNNAHPPSSTSSGFSSQFSLTSSNDSQSSRNSQDRYNNSEGVLDPDDPQKTGNGGLLGKVFGGGWFTPSKSSNRRGSTPSKNLLSNKKSYTNS